MLLVEFHLKVDDIPTSKEFSDADRFHLQGATFYILSSSDDKCRLHNGKLEFFSCDKRYVSTAQKRPFSFDGIESFMDTLIIENGKWVELPNFEGTIEVITMPKAEWFEGEYLCFRLVFAAGEILSITRLMGIMPKISCTYIMIIIHKTTGIIWYFTAIKTDAKNTIPADFKHNYDTPAYLDFMENYAGRDIAYIPRESELFQTQIRLS